LSSQSVLEKPSIIQLRSKADRALASLEAAIAKDLETLEYPARDWLPKRTHESGAHVYDVIVVGAGHCGVTTGFALKRERIGNILIIEKSELGSEGPWQSYARMPDLRTRKAVTGNELGYPNLTFRAYYEAREGEEAYKKLQRISCDEWTCYLLWLRRILDLPVRNGVTLNRITPEGDLFRLRVTSEGKDETLFARRVILTSGPLSMGGSNVPSEIAQGVDPSCFASAYDNYDVNALRGKKVAVIGAGASAFDNAGAALEAGAASVTLLVRRPKIPPVSVIRWTDWSGFLQTYADLSDDQKWRMMHQVQRNAAPPTIRAIRRVEAFKNFEIRFGSPIIAAKMRGQKVQLTTCAGDDEFDFLILATGFSFDLSKSAVLQDMQNDIALWRNRYEPREKASEKYLNSPYLGRNYEFMEKEPGSAPYLKHVFCYNQASTLSMGPTGRVSGLKYGMKRLMVGVCGSFMREDYEHHLRSVTNYNANEFEDHPWMGDS
jgi:cation diffusion facilitator CzcD-associated flavoprotein CzcO